MTTGCVVDHVAAPAVCVVKGCAPQGVRDCSRLLNDFAIQGAALLTNPEVRTLLAEAVQLAGLLKKPASSPQGRQLMLELFTLCALGMDILASDPVKAAVEQAAVVLARVIDLESSKPANAKVLLEVGRPRIEIFDGTEDNLGRVMMRQVINQSKCYDITL